MSDIETWQIPLRGILIYAFTLAIVRLGSKRFLGKTTLFDTILGIMIGSVMSRGIDGSSDMLDTMLAGATLVTMHWVLAAIAFRTRRFGSLIKGNPVLLIENGELLEDAMRRTSISRKDLEEALRLDGMPAETARVQRAYLERDGSISVIPQHDTPRLIDVRVAAGVQTVRIELSGSP